MLLRPAARPVRRPARTALAAAAVIALAGCGGTTSAAGPAPATDRAPALELVRAAGEASARTDSARLALTSTTTVDGKEVVVDATGEYDARSRTGRMEVALPAMPGSPGGGVLEQRLVGDRLYLQVPQLGGTFFELALADLEGTPLAGAADPLASLEALQGVSDDVRETGSDEVRGTATTRYEGTVDVDAVMAQLDGVARDLFEQALGRAELTAIPFVLHLDDDGRVRRLEQDFSAVVDGLGPVTNRTVLDLYDYGVDVEVTAPPADQVQDGAPLLTVLRGLTGGA